MIDNGLRLSKEKADMLTIGEMPELQFWLLIEISPFHSERIICALKDFLVMGYSRKEICERYNISSGYFSSALGRLQRVNIAVSRLAQFYENINRLSK